MTTDLEVLRFSAQDIVRHDFCMKRRPTRQNAKPARALRPSCGQTISALTGEKRDWVFKEQLRRNKDVKQSVLWSARSRWPMWAGEYCRGSSPAARPAWALASRVRAWTVRAAATRRATSHPARLVDGNYYEPYSSLPPAIQLPTTHLSALLQ